MSETKVMSETIADRLEFAKPGWLPISGHVVNFTFTLAERDETIKALRNAPAYDACRAKIDCLSRGAVPVRDDGAERIRELEAALQPFLAVAKVMEFYTEDSMPEMTYPRPECETRYSSEPRCVTLTQADFALVAALQPKDTAK